MEKFFYVGIGIGIFLVIGFVSTRQGVGLLGDSDYLADSANLCQVVESPSGKCHLAKWKCHAKSNIRQE